MSKSDVEGILGKPDEEKGAAGALGDLGGSAKVAVWKDGEKAITITFLNDKVTTKNQAGL